MFLLGQEKTKTGKDKGKEKEFCNQMLKMRHKACEATRQDEKTRQMTVRARVRIRVMLRLGSGNGNGNG